MSRLVLAAVVLLLAMSGCFKTDQIAVIDFQNRTDVEVTVLYESPDGDEQVLAHIGPGSAGASTLFSGTECTPGALIARDTSGQEVATLDGPVCRPSTWVIEAPVPSG